MVQREKASGVPSGLVVAMAAVDEVVIDREV